MVCTRTHTHTRRKNNETNGKSIFSIIVKLALEVVALDVTEIAISFTATIPICINKILTVISVKSALVLYTCCTRVVVFNVKKNSD